MVETAFLRSGAVGQSVLLVHIRTSCELFSFFSNNAFLHPEIPICYVRTRWEKRYFSSHPFLSPQEKSLEGGHTTSVFRDRYSSTRCLYMQEMMLKKRLFPTLTKVAHASVWTKPKQQKYLPSNSLVYQVNHRRLKKSLNRKFSTCNGCFHWWWILETLTVSHTPWGHRVVTCKCFGLELWHLIVVPKWFTYCTCF